MRILQLIQRPQFRGAEVFASQLSLELNRKGHHVELASLFEGDPSFVTRFEPLTLTALNARRAMRMADLPAFRRIGALIHMGGYDVVQANAGDTLKYAALSRRLVGWRTPLVFRNANKMSAFIHGAFHRRWNRWLLRQCDAVISVSETCRRDIVALEPSLEARTQTIPIGVYLHQETVRQVPQGEGPVLLCVASFVQEKNHAFLLRVFNTFRRRHGKGSLWLVGTGPLEALLRETVDRMNLGGSVHFLGARPSIRPLLRSADVLVMPSLIEGLPAVILEAFEAELPVVASAAGGIPEVVRDGVTGFCLEAFDTDTYVARIESALDPGIRPKVVASARKLVTEFYAMDSVVSRFEKAYEGLT